MAEHSIPHFHNSQGLDLIEVGSKEFKCVGALPPFDHPHIYMDMGKDNGAFSITPTVGARVGAEYRFDNGFSVGAYGGVDRALGNVGSGSGWGAEAGVTVGISF